MEGDDINNLKGFVLGLLYGAASPIPGVSGGTLFVFFNMYEDFFQSASWEHAKKNAPMLMFFILGCIAGLLVVSRVIMFFLTYHEMVTLFAFKGLVLGCVPAIYKKASVTKIKPMNIGVFIIALAFMLVLALTGGELTANSSLEEIGGITPIFIVYLFFASFISSIALLIPGVGGAIMMLAFGIYTVYIEAMSTLQPVVLIVLLSSMVLGILAGIKIIKKLLDLCPQSLYSAILGFILGSIFIIFPGFSMNFEGLLSMLFAAVFAIFAYRLSVK